VSLARFSVGNQEDVARPGCPSVLEAAASSALIGDHKMPATRPSKGHLGHFLGDGGELVDL
jgi:hypothetical protein